ncbi:MAG: VPLPA-CTERM sorting domain-containing protein [Alishewanella agri]|nr:VPLPA-CTERM sorting domain-containing protein [Alishewanella agri]
MKKFLSALMLLAGSFVLVQPTAHASLIMSQDIFEVDGTNKALIGSISINVLEASEFDDDKFELLTWFQLTLFGTSFVQQMEDTFFAEFSMSNLQQGLSFLYFEIADEFNNFYQLTYVDDFGAMEIATGDELRFLDISLGNARVQVPVPATLALLLLGVIALATTRRRHLAKR